MTPAGYPDRETCFERLRAARFGDAVTCVYCGSDSVEPTGTTAKGARQYRCRACKRSFNDLTHTVFEERTFSLDEMFYIVGEMDDRPIAEIQRDLGRSAYQPVLDFVHHVRAVHPGHSELPLRELCTPVGDPSSTADEPSPGDDDPPPADDHAGEDPSGNRGQ